MGGQISIKTYTAPPLEDSKNTVLETNADKNMRLIPTPNQNTRQCRNTLNNFEVKIKLKQSLYRPGQALGVPRGPGSPISRQSAHEGGKVVSPMHRLFLSPRKYSWYSFLLEAESTGMTPSGIEPATLL